MVGRHWSDLGGGRWEWKSFHEGVLSFFRCFFSSSFFPPKQQDAPSFLPFALGSHCYCWCDKIQHFLLSKRAWPAVATMKDTSFLTRREERGPASAARVTIYQPNGSINVLRSISKQCRPPQHGVQEQKSKSERHNTGGTGCFI